MFPAKLALHRWSALCRNVSSLIERESLWAGKETMPDLVPNVSFSSSLSLPRLMQPTSSPDSLESAYPIPVKALAPLHDSKMNTNVVSFSGCTSYAEGMAMNRKVLMESSKLKSGHFLPFLVGAKKMEKCRICDHFVHSDEELHCTIHGCGGTYHIACVKKHPHVSSVKSFKCPLHVCFACNGRPHWRCVRCEVASHDDKCSPWPKLMDMKNHPGRAVCWRHSPNWRQGRMDEPEASTPGIEEIFNRLPLPYEDEEFKLDITLKDMTENNMEPPAYVHIRRNVYLVKKKRDYGNRGIGCTSCTSGCSDSCVCRVQCISCSRACHCEETCSNRPFRKDKKIKVVKTELCGWGVDAAEPINKGEFVIEYIGEVIDDALCEKRLWDMKHKGVKNFYMCEISKNFTIDATFKGNSSRFLNHSCDPNCFLEKWQVEGETRVGVFAARSIKDGEPLTYDYRFIQFGAEVECQCGASNCQGCLGSKRKIPKLLEVCWGSKRKRTSVTCISIVTD